MVNIQDSEKIQIAIFVLNGMFHLGIPSLVLSSSLSQAQWCGQYRKRKTVTCIWITIIITNPRCAKFILN